MPSDALLTQVRWVHKRVKGGYIIFPRFTPAQCRVEEPEGERQGKTDKERGHERRVELETWPFDADIARQTPKPAQLVGSKPEHQAYDSQEQADADQHFAEIFHSDAPLYRCAAA